MILFCDESKKFVELPDASAESIMQKTTGIWSK
jgi:hypothetical protein